MSYTSIITDFVNKFLKGALAVGHKINDRKQGIQAYADEQIATLVPIYEDLFADGRATDIETIKSDLSKLTKRYDVPLKYNKNLLDTINEKSVFNGFYNKDYQQLYTNRDLYRLKSTILSAKYSDLPEDELVKNIRAVVKTSKKNAQLMARYEIQRLRGATLNEYYKIPRIEKKYEKVFGCEHHNTRDSHLKYDGQVADADGYFHGALGSFNSTPIPGEYNCQCKMHLRLRKK